MESLSRSKEQGTASKRPSIADDQWHLQLSIHFWPR